MKLTFENLGPLEFGEIELADLTIICGENNTGKTYVTYLIYCLLTSWKHLIDINLKAEFDELKLNGVTKIDLQKKIADSWSKICEDTITKFIKQFPEMLASKSELLAKLSIKVDMPLGTFWKQREFKSELRSTNGNLLIKNSISCGYTFFPFLKTIMSFFLPVTYKNSSLSKYP